MPGILWNDEENLAFSFSKSPPEGRQIPHARNSQSLLGFVHAVQAFPFAGGIQLSFQLLMIYFPLL